MDRGPLQGHKRPVIFHKFTGFRDTLRDRRERGRGPVKADCRLFRAFVRTVLVPSLWVIRF